VPPLKISTPEPGGLSYLSWLRTPSNFQPVEFIQNIIVPTQDMLPFQGRWFYFNGAVAIPNLDFFEFSVTCPLDESWRIDYIILLFTTDTGNVDVRVEIEPAALANLTGLSRIAFMDVENGSEQAIYPTETEIATVARNDTYTYNGKKLVILPAEKLIIASSVIADVGGSFGSITIRYEQIPPPTETPRVSAITPTIQAVT